MKKIIQLGLLVTILLFFSSTKIYATHFAGADLTYRCLGGNDYKITVSFYRDCSGAAAPTSGVLVNFKCNTDPSKTFTSTLYMVPGSGIEVTPGCSAVPTKCSYINGFNNYGIQEYVFEGQVTMPPCSEWEIYYSSSARNPITTVPNNTGNSWFITAFLNNYLAPCNSSPTFSNKPIGIVCTNQFNCFNHGASDINPQDSLVYSFYSPFTSNINTTVTYASPWTYTNFLTSSTPITIDQESGTICFTPTINLTTLTGIKVMEYRKINGVYTHIGTVYRDIQLKVDDCLNKIPTLSGMDTLNTHTYKATDTIYKMEVCYEQNKVISFDINGFDQDTFNIGNAGHPERYNIKWNNGIPQGNFQVINNNSDSAYAHFSWAIQPSDIKNLPRCFTATVRDEACPYNGSQTFAYCLTVRGMKVEIGSDTLLCTGESITYNAIADTTTKNYIWKVNNIATGTPQNQAYYTFASAGKTAGLYELSIETNDGGTTIKCPGRDKAKITVVYQPDVNNKIKDTTVCAPSTLSFNSGPGTVILWADYLGNILSTASTFNPTQGNNYMLYVDGGNGTRCIDSDTFEIAVIDPPTLQSDTCIWSDDAPFEIDGGYIMPNLSYIWSTGDTSKKIEVIQSGSYTLSVYNPLVSPNIKCSDNVIVNILDQNTFIKSIRIQAEDNQPMEGEIDSTGSRTICSHQKLKIFGPQPPNGHFYQYSWAKNNSFVTSTPYYILKEKTAGNNTIQLSVANGCKDEINVEVVHCAVNPPNIITPNGDGQNDKFVISGLENFPKSILLIYDRWGKRIYQSNSYKNDWDGDGSSDGVYFWVLKIADGDGTEYQGNLTILTK